MDRRATHFYASYRPITGRKNNLMSEFDKKLAHAIILLPLHEAAALIDAFIRPFPSLGGVDPATLLASVVST